MIKIITVAKILLLTSFIMNLEIEKNTNLLDEYIRKNRDEWFTQDMSWINDIPITPSKGYNIHPNIIRDEWHRSMCFKQKIGNLTYDVYDKRTHTNPHTVFYYWDGNPIDLKFYDAIDFFTLMIKETGNWTSIFTKGELLLSNRESIFNNSYYVWHQCYEAVEPIFGKYLVEPRHLIGIYSVRMLRESEYPNHFKNGKDIQIAIISLRSIPKELTPIEIPKGQPQIIWRGAYLLIGKEGKTYVHKFDSEDEGGWLFQSITDIAFPDFVQKEAMLCTEYIENNQQYIQDQLAILRK